MIQRLIDIGLEDDYEARCLDIGAPTVAVPPRVLIVVGGGVADPVYDEGVDVEVFDWDNYNDENDGEIPPPGVSARFADLAEPIGVPVDDMNDQ